MLQTVLTRVSTRALLWLSLGLSAIGCAYDTAPRPQGKGEQGLTGPVTITLSAPNSLTPIAPVLEGSNSVKFGGGSNVVSGTVVAMGSGGVQAEPDALLNDTWSRGTAALRDRVRVRGTLHAMNRTLGNGVVINALDTTPVFDPASTLTWTVTYPSGAVNDVLVNADQSKTLAPGAYGAVTANSRATINLSTGTYYLSSLAFESAATINLDQARGSVIIYVANSLSLRGRFLPVGGGSPDLLVAYLGQNGVVVETVFDGAVIAPFTSLTLRNVNATHTGFYAAKDPFLDAGARVQYRAPLAVVAAAKPSGPTCPQMLAGVTPQPNLAQTCGCVSDDDTDRDFVLDCIDGCPYDAHKTSPGVCGCGAPETDSDGDGVPDCRDLCKLDPNNSRPGQCGCAGSTSLKPAGTPCIDRGCPLGPSTCDGAGVCGSRSQCLPATGCKLVQTRQSSYWFCPGPVTRTAAQQACAAKQMALVQIDSVSEDEFVSRFIKGPAWIGGNSLTTSGAWRWSTATSNNGLQYWSGGATGSQRNGLFSHWAASAPGANRCAATSPDGLGWVDANCNQAQAFVCEFHVPTFTGFPTRPPSTDEPPPPRPCVAEKDSGLPDTPDALAQQVDQARNQRIFQGAAANPPPDNAPPCPVDLASNAVGDTAAGAGCQFINVKPESKGCFENSDCSQFGSTFVCRRVQDDPTCKAPNSGPNAPTTPEPGQTCPGHSFCGQISCAQDTLPCDQVEICNPGVEFTATGPDPGSNLGPDQFDPAALFDAGPPPLTPSVKYEDEPTGTGKDHSWCKMQAQHSVPGANQPERNKGGTSGGNSVISFGFDPDLEFNVDANPLALGETDLKMHAAATLLATVSLNDFLGQSYSAPVIDAAAGVRVERCTIRNDETHFRLFGLDVVDLDEFIFNTSQNPSTVKCNDALGNFLLYANRAKKAFRDAQQILHQYRSLKDAGKNLKNFCDDMFSLVGNDVPFFPGGLECYPNEPVEITINRFLDYYQAPGYGQISQLKRAISKLQEGTQAFKDLLPNIKLEFDDLERDESQTIVNVPFAIGPVPMVLQVDVYYKYGLAGGFDLDLEFPFSLDMSAGTSHTIAHAGASVMPHAQAGLGAFVGAGVDLGAFSATVGIEGRVNLGDIKAPIFAGAGLDMVVTEDKRLIPDDIAPPVSLVTSSIPIGAIPKAVKFAAWYDYGAGLAADRIMDGTINARLRISFLFFSREWRKMVVRFHGWHAEFKLIGGKVGADPGVGNETKTVASNSKTGSGSTNVVQGSTGMGFNEAQVPLTELAPVDTPAQPSTAEEVGFDAGKVEKLFYDELCCSKEGEQCTISGVPACCPGMVCSPLPDAHTRSDALCVKQCQKEGASCKINTDCCPAAGFQVTCGSLGTCNRCVDEHGPCRTTDDCCITAANLGCVQNVTTHELTCESVVP